MDNEEIKKRIEKLKKDKLNKLERKKLEQELRILENENKPIKKIISNIGKTFLVINKFMINSAKKQSERKK